MGFCQEKTGALIPRFPPPLGQAPLLEGCEADPLPLASPEMHLAGWRPGPRNRKSGGRGGRPPNHTQPGELVYASCTAPPAGGHVTSAPPPGPLAWLLPPRRPFFLPPWESQDRSARDPSARPRPPAFQTLLGVSSRRVIITSNERDGLRGPTRPPTAAVRPAVRGGRAAPLGTLFRGGGCGLPRPFHAGGGAVRPRWRRPVGWRNCEVNS